MRIVYNSFHGRFSDSPRAVFDRLAERPGTEHAWLAHRDHLAGFPDGVRTVDIESSQARRTLESADVLVANTHTEVEWTKPAGCFYLQTWHGTPLKRIHHDVLWAPEGRLARLDHDVAKWDLMLSPNPVSTPRLRKAFSFDGPVEETGYPRNDVLLDPVRSADVRRKVRESLEVGAEEQVVLYAPTWRDDEVFGSVDRGRWPCDLEELAGGLDGGHLLVRAHNLVPVTPQERDGSTVRDVTAYPDVSDLYLAADVLVTDYSSVMFDFASTGKPMVFFAYDLDAFRDSIRGFYFDFVPEAPGPVVTTADELLAALRDVERDRAAYEDRYAEFRRTYASLEDGHATDRVVELLEQHCPGLAPHHDA